MSNFLQREDFTSHIIYKLGFIVYLSDRLTPSLEVLFLKSENIYFSDQHDNNHGKSKGTLTNSIGDKQQIYC